MTESAVPKHDEPIASGGFWYWYGRGLREVFSLPALMLMTAFVGFAGFAREAGLPAGQVVLMTLMIWALPAKFVLAAAIQSGASLAAAFIAVTLSSARLMPMVVSIVPEMRTKGTRTWVLVFLSHFVAITAWVIAMDRFREVPREWRTTFFAGLGCTLTLGNTALVGVVYGLAPSLPAELLGALFFLTPVYFLTSIWASTRDRAGHIAMIIGLALGPLFHQVAPEFDILYAGVVGGTLAFFADRLWTRREGK